MFVNSTYNNPSEFGKICIQAKWHHVSVGFRVLLKL